MNQFDKNKMAYSENTKLRGESLYKTIGKVFCLYFNENVSFNIKGLKHLKFKSSYRIRRQKDYYIRLKYIHLAPMILKLSNTVQEKQTKNIFIKTKTRNKHKIILKNCNYYGFIAIIRDANIDKRFKVIVRQVDGGKKHFWSIIPYWKNRNKQKIHSGDMTMD